MRALTVLFVCFLLTVPSDSYGQLPKTRRPAVDDALKKYAEAIEDAKQELLKDLEEEKLNALKEDAIKDVEEIAKLKNAVKDHEAATFFDPHVLWRRRILGTTWEHKEGRKTHRVGFPAEGL